MTDSSPGVCGGIQEVVVGEGWEDVIPHHNNSQSALIMQFNLEATPKVPTCPVECQPPLEEKKKKNSVETLTGTSPLSDDKNPVCLSSYYST